MIAFYQERVRQLRTQLDGRGIATAKLSNTQKLARYNSRHRDALVDFDATLCQWSYPDMGEPTEDAKWAMAALQEMGMRVVVYTARMDRSIYPREERLNTQRRIEEWLVRHGIPFDEVDLGEYGKRVAGVIIDDKAAHFCGDWSDTLNHVRAIRELDEEKFEKTKGVYGVDVRDRSGAQAHGCVPPGWEWESGDSCNDKG